MYLFFVVGFSVCLPRYGWLGWLIGRLVGFLDDSLFSLSIFHFFFPSVCKFIFFVEGIWLFNPLPPPRGGLGPSSNLASNDLSLA